MYVAPVLLALFVIGCTTAVRRGKAQYTKLAETQPPSRISHPPDSRSQGASQLDRYRRSAVLGFRPCRERGEGGLTPALTAIRTIPIAHRQRFESRHVGNPLDRHPHAAGFGDDVPH